MLSLRVRVRSEHLAAQVSLEHRFATQAPRKRNGGRDQLLTCTALAVSS